MLIAYIFHTLYPSSIQDRVHCGFIRVKSFELRKTCWTDELSAVYDVNLQYIYKQQKVHVRYHSLMHLVVFPVFTLAVRNSSASSVKHPLFPQCICNEFVPDNPFGVVILFYPLSAAKLPIFIYLTSLLQTYLVRSSPFLFSQIFDSFVDF